MGTGGSICTDSDDDTYFAEFGDCDDTNTGVYLGAPEIVADGIDNSCKGYEECYLDVDGDGYRTDDTYISADGDCSDAGEALYTLPGGDCDDSNEDTYS